eukprot:SM000047S16842  [mRNA]  locus=s47:244617:248444:- [translate_table: standard]
MAATARCQPSLDIPPLFRAASGVESLLAAASSWPVRSQSRYLAMSVLPSPSRRLADHLIAMCDQLIQLQSSGQQLGVDVLHEQPCSSAAITSTASRSHLAVPDDAMPQLVSVSTSSSTFPSDIVERQQKPCPSREEVRGLGDDCQDMPSGSDSLLLEKAADRGTGVRRCTAAADDLEGLWLGPSVSSNGKHCQMHGKDFSDCCFLHLEGVDSAHVKSGRDILQLLVEHGVLPSDSPILGAGTGDAGAASGQALSHEPRPAAAPGAGESRPLEADRHGEEPALVTPLERSDRLDCQIEAAEQPADVRVTAVVDEAAQCWQMTAPQRSLAWRDWPERLQAQDSLEQPPVGLLRGFSSNMGTRPGSRPRRRRLRQDPLVHLGEDVFTLVLAKSDAHNLVSCAAVSTSWRRAASSDHLWKPKLDELLASKAHVPRAALSASLSVMESYAFCIRDAQRTAISLDDLCDHTWEFRFKQSSPKYWLERDPSYSQTGPPMLRRFHRDYSITAGPDDKVWGGHEATFVLVELPCADGSEVPFVQINHWPRLAASRRADWGWQLHNSLCYYSSTADAVEAGGTGPASL